MRNNELSIPFELKYVHSNIFEKLLHKLKLIIGACVRRSIDIIISFIMCLLLVPFSVLVKLRYVTMGDYRTIFTSTRCFGKNGKIIHVIKYRSIDKNGKTNRLRDTALDNLPKFINVLFGSMSLVGPQPYEVDKKDKMGVYFNRITQLKPGITGIAQISYVKDYTIEMRVANDIKYYYRRNAFLDFKIILITMLITLPRRNQGELLSTLTYTVKDIWRVIARATYMVIKRVLDFVLALALLIILSVPMMIIALAIKIDSKGPVFFKQARTGKDGKIFTLIKFRSMVQDNDVYDLTKEDRHTKVGNFLRRTSLDELGQLFNILRGDMSFIGPRPWIVDYYEEMNDEQRHRYDVRPGITGLAQAKGRNSISIIKKINYDLEYVEKYSLLEDIKIIFLTVETVLSKDGVEAGKNTIQKELNILRNNRLICNR